MRTHIVRKYDAKQFRDVLVVEQWYTPAQIDEYLASLVPRGVGFMRPHDKATKGTWEQVAQFDLHEYDKACAFAMDLSMTKKAVTELVVFDDGHSAEIAENQSAA